MPNTNALQGIRCPNCHQTERFKVAARVFATVLDNGVDEYVDPEWEGDALTKCPECEWEGEWKDFQVSNQRPYSVCVYCGEVIIWFAEHKVWWRGDFETVQEPGICNGGSHTDHPHQPRWLTLGEFRAKTEHLPDTMPITGYTGDVPGLDEWVNLRLEEVPEKYNPHTDAPSLLITVANDFDTRQW